MAWVDGLAQVRWELVGLGAVDGYFGGQLWVLGRCEIRRRGSMVNMQLWLGHRLVDRRRRPGAGRLAKEVMLRAVILDG